LDQRSFALVPIFARQIELRPCCESIWRAQSRPMNCQRQHPVEVFGELIPSPACGEKGAGGGAVMETGHAGCHKSPGNRIVAIPRKQRNAGLRSKGIPLALAAGRLRIKSKPCRRLLKDSLKLTAAPSHARGIGG